MRVLIVAVERQWIDSLVQALRRSGHAVDRVSDTDGAVNALLSHDFQLLIADLSLTPRRDTELLRRLREMQPAVTIVALAAGDSDGERIRALDAGADDCIAAPHSLAEIEARVRVWSRRSFGSTTPLVQHGPLSYDAVERIAYLDDRPLRLAPREISVLEVLMQRIGRPVSKDQFADRLFQWGEEVSYNAIEASICRLRQKLGSGPVRILTMRGVGYSLEPGRRAS